MVPEPGLNPSGQPQQWPAQPPSQPGQWPPAQAAQWPSARQWPEPPAPPSALPVTPREYHEFFRTPRLRWWKPLAAIALFVAGWFVLTLVISGPVIAIDMASGRLDAEAAARGEITMTPLVFTVNNVSLALAIPVAGLTAWAVFGQRPRWISSITGGFRWSLFWRFALVALPLFLLSFGVEILVNGFPELAWNDDSAFLIAVIALTTPFQAAGEEYGVRGLLARSVGSWFGSSRAGLVVAALVTSALFTALHVAQDPWLNAYYFTVGIVCSVLVWRTGGLEAAVALHVVNNLIGEVTLPFGDLGAVFDRSAGAAGPWILVQMAFTVAVAAGMLWLARRRQLPMASAPANHPAG